MNNMVVIVQETSLEKGHTQCELYSIPYTQGEKSAHARTTDFNPAYRISVLLNLNKIYILSNV